MTPHTSLELCAGAGGTAIGLEQAGFRPGALVEIDAWCCRTLLASRPDWQVFESSIERVDGTWVAGQVDLLSAGLPCTPHSRGGRQLGEADERHLWATALRITAEAAPRAVMLETADAILAPRFDAERATTLARLHTLGYRTWWQVIDASRYGVPQRRRQAVLVGLRDPEAAAAFRFTRAAPPTVGDTLWPLVAARGWPGADAWRAGAQDAAPTVVGGSKKHGGPDPGPSQTKAAFRRLGINPMGIADEAPGPDGKYQRGAGKVFDAGEAGPMLTVRMGARLQGFPDDWQFSGGKGAQWGQVGNAFPPPVARVLGLAIAAALAGSA